MTGYYCGRCGEVHSDETSCTDSYWRNKRDEESETREEIADSFLIKLKDLIPTHTHSVSDKSSMREAMKAWPKYYEETEINERQFLELTAYMHITAFRIFHDKFGDNAINKIQEYAKLESFKEQQND